MFGENYLVLLPLITFFLAKNVWLQILLCKTEWFSLRAWLYEVRYVGTWVAYVARWLGITAIGQLHKQTNLVQPKGDSSRTNQTLGWTHFMYLTYSIYQDRKIIMAYANICKMDWNILPYNLKEMLMMMWQWDYAFNINWFDFAHRRFLLNKITLFSICIQNRTEAD